MARQRGIIKLEGTVGGLTFVNSSKYEQHARSRRGTYRKAKLNDVLEANTENIKGVTSFGSPILKDLKAVERGFATGGFWAEMMKRMMKAKENSMEALLESIKDLELSQRYLFAQYFSSSPVLSFTSNRSRLFLDVEIVGQPHFPDEVSADEYLLEVVVLFLDGKGNCVAERMETEWLSSEEDLGIYEMAFEKPKGAKYFLVVEGIKAGTDNEAIESFFARGYKIWGWGNC